MTYEFQLLSSSDRIIDQAEGDQYSLTVGSIHPFVEPCIFKFVSA